MFKMAAGEGMGFRWGQGGVRYYCFSLGDECVDRVFSGSRKEDGVVA